MGFDIQQPTAYPYSAPPGPVVLTVGITSNEPVETTVAVRFLIYEGSLSPLAGPRVDYQDKYITISPGQTRPVQVVHNSLARGEQRRDVGIEIWRDGQVIASRPDDDDIFFVTSSTPEITAIQIGTIRAYPYQAPAGPVQITVPVTSNSTGVRSVSIRCRVYEGSIWPAAGQLLSDETKQVTINAGSVLEVNFSHAAAARVETRRDVNIEIYYNGALVASREDDDIFYVEKPVVPPVTGDFATDGLVITNFSKEVPKGDPIFIDVQATVKDVNANWPDYWQIAGVAAVVDDKGAPDATLRTQYIVGSAPAFLTVLTLHTPLLPLHLNFTPMPDKEVKVAVKLFANHSAGPAFDWTAWGGNGASGWQLLSTKVLTIAVPGAEMTKWLIIGGAVFVGGIGIVVLLTQRK